MRFARRIVDNRNAVRAHRRHQRIFGRRNAHFVKENIRADEFVRRDSKLPVDVHPSAQFGERKEMRVKAAMPDDVAPRRRKHDLAAPRKHGACKQNGRTDFLGQRARDFVCFDFSGSDFPRMFIEFFHRCAERFKDFEHNARVFNRGNIAQNHAFFGEKSGGNARKSGVFISARLNRAFDGKSALNFVLIHIFLQTIVIFCLSAKSARAQ